MLTRRRLLTGALAVPAVGLLASGCSTDTAPVGPTPDETARDTARADEQQLLDRYAATLSTHPELAGQLGPVRDEHVAHLHALAPPPTSGTPSPTGAASAAASPVDVPADPDTAVRALVAAESVAAAARGQQVPVTGAELAVLLASIGASEQTHAVWLGG